MKRLRRICFGCLILAVTSILLVVFFAQKSKPDQITYGMSFNTFYAQELGLDWQQTYDAIVDDLGVRHLRLAAHWPMVEPVQNIYTFGELDHQIIRAEEVGAEVVLAVGRRLPRWPECHTPDWASKLDIEKRNQAQLRYMEAVINRYKDSPAVKIWQVENEPFLSAFAFEHCGELDSEFLDKEIDLVRSLDPTRPIQITDSGNLGTWYGAYSRADIFGTSVYVHFWNPELGQFRTWLPPWFYRIKDNLMALRYGEKESVLIELSAEPWLLEPIVDVPISVQFSRMDLQKIEDILVYAEGTHYEKQYLWGAEWWYWLMSEGHPEIWKRGQELFPESKLNTE